MIRLILFLVVSAVLAVVAVWLADQPGQVTILFRGYEAQTTVGVLLAALLLGAVALTLLVEIYRILRSAPRRIRRNAAHKREVRGYESIASGLIAAASGDHAAAAWHNRQASRLLPERPGTLLLATQNAQLQGRDDEAHKLFQQMIDRPATELLGLRGLLAHAVKGGDRAEALELARRAYKLAPRTAWVQQGLFDLLVRDGQWEEAGRVLDGIAREKLEADEIIRRRRAILLHLTAKERRTQGRNSEALDAARKAQKLAPGFAPAAVQVSELAMAVDRRRLARRAVEIGWQAEPTPELARAWLALRPTDSPQSRYDNFRYLQRIRPDHVETWLSLGELAIAARKLDAGRRDLEKAVSIDATQRGYRLLAELARTAGEPEKAADWLAKAQDARPDRAWVRDDTGDVVPEWSPFAGDGSFDAIHWAEPPRMSRLLLDSRPLALTDGDGAAQPPPVRQPAPDMSTAASSV
ncbi:MAG: heme biosynthesis HemY N-terminal domain-containing protein [Geminicoccaceae bacterium]